MRNPETRRELRRAAVWLGLAAAMALVVILIQPILIILAGLVFASWRWNRASTTAGWQWMVPTDHRAEFVLTLGRMASQLRRLLAGRLAGMVFKGILMWIALIRRHPDGARARDHHRHARLHPQYRRVHFGRVDDLRRV